MARGTTGVRALALVLGVVFAIGSGGCQKLYGGKSEKLRAPGDKKKKPVEAEALSAVKYVDECAADFRGDPAKVRPQTMMANQLVGEGETALASSEKAKDPKSQGELIKLGIDKFRNALIKDPYNHDATLQLALAYDRVLRKGCALVMLKRLAALEANPRFAKGAKLAADRVMDNEHWFKDYRKDAVSAVGR